MARWYVVNSKVRAENLAFMNLVRQGFEAYFPRYPKRRWHARRLDLVHAPLFPRYLFVRLDPLTSQWRKIRSTIGVTDLVCNGNSPVPVSDGVVEEIQNQEDDQGLVKLGKPGLFKPGDKLRVSFGPRTDVSAIFSFADDDQRVVVFLEMMGRSVKARVPAETVSMA